jgi:hypothetical protein
MGSSFVAHRRADRPKDRANLDICRVERQRHSRRKSDANAHRAAFYDEHVTF